MWNPGVSRTHRGSGQVSRFHARSGGSNQPPNAGHETVASRAIVLRRDVMRGWNFSSNADWMVALLLVLTVAAAAFA